VDAQVAIGGFQQGLQLIESERTIDGKRTDDAQTNAFVNQAVKVRGHGFAACAAGDVVSSAAGFSVARAGSTILPS
jgi:hypothetical protein